jgi:hypothetical protein
MCDNGDRPVTKRVALSALLALAAVAAVAAADNVSLTIRFFDKKIYYAGDQVRVEATVTNASSASFRFKVADSKVWSFDFEVATPTLDKLAHAEQFTIDRSSNQPVFSREISLEPGEQYGLVLELDSFIGLGDPGVFSVRALFYPELYRGSAPRSVASNTLSLAVRPQAETPEEKARIDTESGMPLTRADIPPDQVVANTIVARQKSQWDKFFLYLDLESLLRQNPDRDRVFRRSSEEERARQLAQYRKDLMQQVADQEVLLRPSSFEIQKTSYTPAEAQVVVRSAFAYTDFTEWKRYTYRLRRVENSWLIVAYEVSNLGTE